MSEPFACWLRRQRHRRDRVGQLARDVLADASPAMLTGTPRMAAVMIRWRLAQHPASPYALAAVQQAEREYQEQTTNHEQGVTK